jgi:CPA2 family monovalent cation:H+ antiporter-2
MEGFLFQATIYLSAAVLAVPVATRLGLGSVLGYLMAGILIGPVLGLVGSETEDLQHFAEFGVVMMLFLIGLELEPRSLWDMRRSFVGLGGIQVVGTTAAVAAGAMAFGLDWRQALAVGLILALSSTAIVLQTLSEKNLMRTRGGRSIFSVLITQDVAVIPMLALLPLLAVANAGDGGDHHPADSHGGGMSLVEGLSGWEATLVTLGAVAAVILAGRYLVRPAFLFIDRARLREMHVAFALLIVVGIATLMNLVGLTPALGAFMAGVVLASSEFRHELESDIEPFKGMLLGLFFITVGAGISFPALLAAPGLVVSLTLLTMVLKGLILWGIATAARLSGRDRWLFTLGLAQAGEFGFVLVSFASQQAVVPGAVSSVLLLVIALSMLLTPLAFIAYEWMARRQGETVDELPADEIDQQHPVIIAGVGRFGQVVNRMLQSAAIPTTVLDNDLEAVQLMRRFGFKGFYGDPTRRDILEAAGLADARVLVVTLDDPAGAIRLVRTARRARPDLRIVARARDRVHVYQLYRAGADDIVREMFDSSVRAGRYALERMGLTEYEAHERATAFYKTDREALKELAALWKPGVKITDNPVYMERARQLNADLETAIVTELERREAGGHDRSSAA